MIESHGPEHGSLATVAKVNSVSFKEMWVDQTLSMLSECARTEEDEMKGNREEKIEAGVKPSAEVLS